MGRTFDHSQPEPTRYHRKPVAPGDPEGWEALGEGYTALAELFGADLEVTFPVQRQIPGTATSYEAVAYVDTDVLDVNPFDLDLERTSHQNALIEVHGLVLGEIAHALHTQWSHEFEASPALIASSLEDIRSERRLINSSPTSAPWIRAALPYRVEHASTRTTDGRLMAVLMAVEVLGRALLGVTSTDGAADVLELLENHFDDAALGVFADVVTDLKMAGDTDADLMADLTARLWALVAPPQEPVEEESSEDSSDEGEPSDGESGEGEPSKSGSSSKKPSSSSTSESSQDGEGEEGEGEVTEMTAADAAKVAQKVRRSAAKAAEEIREEKLEELIDAAESMLDKPLTASSRDGDSTGTNGGRPDSDEGDEPADEADSDESGDALHGFGAGNSRVRIRASKVSTKDLSLRRRMADRIRKAQWRDRDIVEVSSNLPPGRLNTRQAMVGEVQKSRGEMVTAKPWRMRKHRVVETKRVRVAVLCDASGSMDPYVAEFSRCAWAVTSSVRDIGGRSIGIAFGDRAEVIDPIAAKARTTIPVYPADGGSEAISDALDIAVKELDLLDADGGSGPRVVVIFSDGHWVDDYQNTHGDETLDKLVKSGAVVIMVAAGEGCEPALRSHPLTDVMPLLKARDFNEALGDIIVKSVKSA
jgi:hypothetical protein